MPLAANGRVVEHGVHAAQAAFQTGLAVRHGHARLPGAVAPARFQLVAPVDELAHVVLLVAGVVAQVVVRDLAEHRARGSEGAALPLRADFGIDGTLGLDAVGHAAREVEEHGLLQARTAAGLRHAGMHAPLRADVPNGVDAGVELAFAGALAPGRGQAEVVIAQAGGDGERLEGPDAFAIQAPVGFFLASAADQVVDFLAAHVHAVFDAVVLPGRDKARVGARALDVGVVVGRSGAAAAQRPQRALGVIHLGVIDVGVGLLRKAQVAALVFEVGGVVFQVAVIQRAACQAGHVQAQGAVAALAFMALADGEAVIRREIPAQLEQVRALVHGGVLDLFAVAVFVVFLVHAVEHEQAVKALAKAAIAGQGCACALVALRAGAHARAEVLAGGEQIGRIHGGHADGASCHADARAGRARAFFHFNALEQRRVEHEAALVVKDLRALPGVVHGESEVVFAQAANAEHLRSAVAAADMHAGLLREHVFHVHHGVFIDRLAALDAASGAAGRDLHGIERVAGGAFFAVCRLRTLRGCFRHPDGFPFCCALRQRHASGQHQQRHGNGAQPRRNANGHEIHLSKEHVQETFAFYVKRYLFALS